MIRAATALSGRVSAGPARLATAAAAAAAASASGVAPRAARAMSGRRHKDAHAFLAAKRHSGASLDKFIESKAALAGTLDHEDEDGEEAEAKKSDFDQKAQAQKLARTLKKIGIKVIESKKEEPYRIVCAIEGAMESTTKALLTARETSVSAMVLYGEEGDHIDTAKAFAAAWNADKRFSTAWTLEQSDNSYAKVLQADVLLNKGTGAAVEQANEALIKDWLRMFSGSVKIYELELIKSHMSGGSAKRGSGGMWDRVFSLFGR